MYYKLENIINEEQRHQLLDVYNSLKSELAHQDYNLFDVDKRHPSKEQAQLDCFKAIDQYASNHEQTFRHYFLNYTPEAFTKFHTDNDDAVGLTIVTFLDKSDDLIGGEALAMLPYMKKSRPETHYRKGDATDPGSRVIPKVINMEVGQSLVYDKSLMHGVGQVEKGNRLVLISWYGNQVGTTTHMERRLSAAV